jgi:hypothetical protein
MLTEPRLFGSHSSYDPPAFNGVSEQERPHTLCADCPESVWFQTEHWQCFCSLRKAPCFDFREGIAPVRRCDGREIALYRMMTEGS